MISRDLRYALRLYRRTPVFSGVAALVLAIAVAVATAVFSLYSHLALRAVPGVQGGDRMVSIGLARDANEWIPFSLTQFAALAEALTVPDALVAASALPYEVEIDGLASELTIAGVNPGFLRALGVRILLGADLDAASADPAAPNAVISERVWREQFDARPGVIGSTIQLDDRTLTVVGVAGGGFAGLRRGTLRDDLWIPLEAALEMASPQLFGMGEAQRRQMAQSRPFLRVSARLPVGVGIERLQQELDLVWPRLRDATDTAISSALMRLEALPGTAADPRQHLALVRQSQLLVGGAVLVLLVASLNLASFMLARGPGRLAELRTRLAVGASGPVIVRQLFVEAALLIATATGLGLLLHFWLRSLLLRLPPFVDVPASWLQLQTDWRVAVFIIAAALVVTLIAGLLPAVRIASQSGGLTLAAPTALGHRGRNLQPLLVLQMAVATLVVLAGTLFANEVRRLERAPIGFDVTGIMAGQLLAIDPEAGRGVTFRQGGAGMMEQFIADLLERLTALGGVEAVALASAVPFHAPPTSPGVIELAGVAEQPAEDRRRAYHNRTTPEFFRILAPQFLHGRPYDGTDPLEAVVSVALARQLWGRDDVVGERLMVADGAVTVSGQGAVVMVVRPSAGGGDAPREVYTVVGVVDDIRYAGAEEERPPMLYRQWSGSLAGQRYVVRGPVDPGVLHPVVDEMVRERFAPMHAEPPVALAASMRAALRDERARSRLALGAAGIALLLTVVGLYASMQHMVDARRGEMAVRKAIGATDGDLVRMILRRAGTILAWGCSGALVAAFVFAERTQTLLLGLNALSLSAWAVTLAIVAATGLAAAWLPALRAGRVDPAVALRYD